MSLKMLAVRLRAGTGICILRDCIEAKIAADYGRSEEFPHRTKFNGCIGWGSVLA
jgi:hypothetical protein